MEIACTQLASAVAGAERLREEHRLNELNECTVTWDVPKLDVCKEEEVVSGGFIGDVCVLCGGCFAFPTHQTEHVEEVCCHLCQVNFSQKNLLALHLKNTHPKSRMLCTTCTIHMGQNLTKDQNVESNVIQNKTVLDDEMEEVVGRMNETEENSITDSTEDNKTISLHDHSYVSSPTCRSTRETQNNVVMYTSSENVLVFVNETDKASPKSSSTESDQQRTSVDDRTVCSGIHDHDYFSIQNLANHMLTHKTLRSPNNVINSINKDIDVCNSKAETTLSPKDALCTQSDLDQIWKDELLCMGLLDHTYFFRPSHSNHTVLSKQVPSLQLEWNNKQIQEDIVGGYEVIIQGSDHEDSDTLSADDLAYTSDDELESDTDSYTSCTDSNAGTLDKDCTSESWSACQNPHCENTYQKSPSPVHYENPNPATSLNKDLRDCSSCGLHKVHTEKSTKRSTCTQSFPCSQCEIHSHSPATSPCTSTTHKLPVQVMATGSSSCAQKVLTGSVNGDQGQDKSPIFTVNQKQIGQVHVVRPLPSKMVTQTRSPSSPILLSSQCQGQKPHQIGQAQVLSQLQAKVATQPPSPSSTTTQILSSRGRAKMPPTVTQKQFGRGQDLSPLQIKVVTKTTGSSTITPTTTGATPIVLSSQDQGQVPPISKFIQEQIRQVQVLSKFQAKVATQPPPSSTTQILSSQGRVEMPPVFTVTQKQFARGQDLSPLQIKVVTKTTGSSTITPTTAGATPIVLGSQVQGQVPPISKFIQEQIRHVQVLSSLHPKVPSQPPSPSSTTQILSSQGRVEMPPISTVTQKQFGQGQDLKTTSSSSSSSTTTATTQILHSSQDHRQMTPVSTVTHMESKHVQLSKFNVPLLDICKSSPSTPISPSSQGPLKIVAIFMNQSRELALQKRLCQSWRSKAVFPCRQCGAVSRQFSLGVRHRYQHRGPRPHRCQCGRAFQQLMHLLRHQVQHAEATRYVCASCGQMFCGTQQLVCHQPLFRITASNRKKQTNKKCRNTFQCYCGRSFMRPAALLWHMLKNPNDRKPRLKGFRIS